jgi:hypothetical protein
MVLNVRDGLLKVAGFRRIQRCSAAWPDTPDMGQVMICGSRKGKRRERESNGGGGEGGCFSS